MITEVEGLTNKIRSLDEGRSKALGQAMDLETDLQIEMNELKQELKGMHISTADTHCSQKGWLRRLRNLWRLKRR